MKKTIAIIPIIFILVVIVVMAIILQLPNPEIHLNCLQHNLESIPHMKWNCYYFTSNK